jgi:undecaprenyl-diphosphatase
LASELSAAEAVARPTAGRKLARDLFLAYVAAWIVGILYAFVIRASSTWDQGAAWEREMLTWFHAWKLAAWLDAVVLQVPLTGTNITLLPLAIVVGWWLWKKKQRGIIALQLLVVTTGSLSLNPTMKYLLGRSRPDLFPRRGMYAWASYPSGHAIVAVAVYFTVARVLHREREWRWPYVVAAAMLVVNLYSRLYLGVHWPTDIIGGVLLGLVWMLAVEYAFQPFGHRSRAASAAPGGQPDPNAVGSRSSMERAGA